MLDVAAFAPAWCLSVFVVKNLFLSDPTTSGRLPWLDLFRGAAVVLMVETHTVNTFLATPQRATSCFSWLDYFNGLVAPAFLFIAGFAQGLGMRRSRAAPRGWGRKARRLLGIWLLGYALHFPAPSLLAGRWGEALALWQRVDILQCLAVSLGLLLAIERWTRRWVDASAAMLLLLAVFAAPAVATWRFLPAALLGYFNDSAGSLFPLLPWLGFVCAGFLASGRLTAGWWLAGALALESIIPGAPGFFFQRLAWLAGAVLMMRWLSHFARSRWLLFAGRESLAIYAAHLVLIEALAALGLPRMAAGFAGCVALFAAVLAAASALAWLWAHARIDARPPVRD